MTSLPDPSLEAGLAALKAENYSDAIAHLEGICEFALDEPAVLRAQMGLVVAYERTGEIDKAIALCQSLSKNPNPQIQNWGSSSLADLTQRYPQNGNTETTPANSDASGFVPFDPTTTPPASNSTGFVPLQVTPQAPRTPVKPPATPPKTTQASTSLPKVTPASNAPASSSDRVAFTESSTTQDPKADTFTPSSKPATDHRPEPVITQPLEWRQAGRAQGWRPLKPLKLTRLWFIQLGTAIAFFWAIRWVLQFGMATANDLLLKVPYARPIQLFYRDPAWGLVFILALIFCLSPWLMDQWLKRLHSFQPLSLSQLGTQSSEAVKMMQRVCRQQKIALPTLGLLPTSAPIVFTYGNLPRNARIVVSQGLLDQLQEDEIATLYASQLGHIIHRDFALMSGIVLTLQVPYAVYWQVSQWGDRIHTKSEAAQDNAFVSISLRLIAYFLAIVAAVSYGVYWLLRVPVLWFSRARIYYSDRVSVDSTGNPNGLTRALLKMAIGIAEEVQKLGQTSWLLESFDLFMPLGHRQALTLGSSYAHTSFESVLQWDWINPYRNWLIINYAHPLTGDRLQLLARYAQFWKLETELDLLSPTPSAAPQAKGNKILNGVVSLLTLKVSRNLPLLPSAITSALVLGFAFRGLLWIIGWIADWISLWQLIWLHQDKNLLTACVLISFSVAIFIQINAYFPDITSTNAPTEDNLLNVYTNPEALPSKPSQPVRLTGKLLGRRGISNWLGQDLILQTNIGLLKLHFLSYLGSVGNLFPQPTRPGDLVDRSLTVTGWFRRGVTPWIDIETLRTQGGRTSRANHPFWYILLATAAAVWAAYIIYQGRV